MNCVAICYEKDVQNRKTFAILAPRGQAPFGQHQESRPLGRSCTVSPRFADFSSPCECSESNLANLMSWEYETITLRMFRQLDLPGRGPDSWYWLKGARSLGTRMTLYRNKCYNHLLLPICYPLNPFGIFSAISIFRTFLQGEMFSVTSGLPQDSYISSFFFFIVFTRQLGLHWQAGWLFFPCKHSRLG